MARNIKNNTQNTIICSYCSIEETCLISIEAYQDTYLILSAKIGRYKHPEIPREYLIRHPFSKSVSRLVFPLYLWSSFTWTRKYVILDVCTLKITMLTYLKYDKNKYSEHFYNSRQFTCAVMEKMNIKKAGVIGYLEYSFDGKKVQWCVHHSDDTIEIELAKYFSTPREES